VKPVSLAWILEKALIVAPECDKRREGVSNWGTGLVADSSWICALDIERLATWSSEQTSKRSVARAQRQRGIFLEIG
jgi:hypothetical protein